MNGQASVVRLIDPVSPGLEWL